MSVQIITSPLGKRLIVLPARDCEKPVAAIEDREDSAAVAIFRRRLAVGEEEWFPWR